MWYNKYIGLPYKDGGRDATGLDCWGLVRLVYQDKYSVELPSFTSSYSTAKDREHIHELIARHKESWENTQEPVEGSVVLLRILGTETHVGVYLGDNKFLHVREGTAAVVESVDSSMWKHRVVGYFNYKENFAEKILVTAAPNPLKTQTIQIPVLAGTTLQFLADWVATEYKTKAELVSKSIFMVNGKVIPQTDWQSTKLKENDSVEYRVLPGDSGTFRMVAFFALAIVAPMIALEYGALIGGSAFGLGIGTAAGTALVGAAVTIAGSALINAIAPIRPPAEPNTPAASQAQNLISGATNQPIPYGAIPVVLGKMRVTPPVGATNYISFKGSADIQSFSEDGNSAGVSGRDTYVDMLLIWGYGPVYIDAATLRIGQVQVYKDSSLTTTNYDGIVIQTLDRITEPTSAQLAAFNAIYGRDVQEEFPNVQLTYQGLPPVQKSKSGSMPWTPQPKPTADTGWVESGFTQNTEQVSFAIHFPQGLRATIIKGDEAGQERPCPVQFEIDYKYNTGSGWTAWQKTWGRFTVGGKLATSSSSTSYQEYGIVSPASGDNDAYYGYYTATKTVTENEILSGGKLADAFTWTLTKNRAWPAEAQVQVRVRRVTGDETEPNDTYRYSHQAVLQAVTSFNNANPAVDPPNSKIAKTALTIKASEEINGQIDGINAVVQTVCKDWNSATQTWVTRATSNPASLYRYVLQHPANALPVLDSQLDLVQIQRWHEYCNTSRTVSYNNDTYNNVTLQYNSVFGGSQRSVMDVLRDICSAGRGSPAMLDGKWTVVIDEPKSTIVQHFTPHNSWGFEATKLLPRMPEALKVQFNDRDSDYQQKEIIVGYAGKDINNAQLLESIQLPGITSTAEAVDHAKWHLAQIKLRPEVYTINTDIEYIVCSRGDRVKVTHDVPMWGLGSARIKNTYGTSSSNITVLELDDTLVIDSTGSYTIRVRSSSGASNTYNINKTFSISQVSRTNNVVTITTNVLHPLNVGDVVVVISSNGNINTASAVVTSLVYNANGPIGFTYELTGTDISSVVATGTISLTSNYYKSVQLSTAATQTTVSSGDLILFGGLNNESQDLIVTKIEPTTNNNARITLVDYGVTSSFNIFTQYKEISSDTIFNANITQPPTALFNQVAGKLPIVNPNAAISDERVIIRIAPGIYQYVIKVPYTNATDLSNDIGFVQTEVIPANMPDTSGGYIFNESITNNSVTIKNVQEGDIYRYRLRYVTKSGKLGTWTEWYGHRVVGKTNPPSAVSGIGYTIIAGTGLQLYWDSNPEIDVTNYEIRTVDSGWGTNTLYEFKGPNTSHIVLPPTQGNTSKWYIKAIDDSGLYSTNSTLISYTTQVVPSVVLNTVSHSFNSTSLTASVVDVTWEDSAPLFGLDYYEISYGGTIKTAKSNTITIPANWLGNNTITIKTVDLFGNKSAATSYNIFKQAPNPPVSPTSFVSQGTLNISWSTPAVTSIAIWGYEVSTNPEFTSAGIIFKGSANSCQVPNSTLVVGADDYFIRTIDVDNRVSSSAALTYTLELPTNITDITEYYSTSSLTEASVELRWDQVTSEFGTAYYELSYDNPVTGLPITKQTLATSIIIPANWVGNKLFTIKVADRLGNLSTGYSESIAKLPPNSILNLRAQVIDNNVLLYWNYPEKTTLPIAHALVKKGTETDTWETAEIVGTKSGEFTSLSELSAGKYVYFIAAVDTDNRESVTPVLVAATVSQPPDFKFNGELSSEFIGTKSNAASYAGELFLPVNTSETWQSHFTARSWTSPQSQVTAGYPVFIQPGTTSPGYYEEVFDYGNVLGSSQITISKIESVVVGNVIVSTDISISTNNIDYTTYSGASSIFATNFRYIKIRLTVTPTTTGSIYKLSSLKVRLDAKQKTESGSIAVVPAGTIVNFENEFVDVQSVALTAAGSTPVTVVYDLKDTVLTGTYSLSSNVCTVNISSHGLIVGQKVRLYFTSGTAASGLYIIQSATTNSYTVNLVSANTSGNVTSYPNSMRLFAFTSNTGAAVAANTSYTIRGY